MARRTNSGNIRSKSNNKIKMNTRTLTKTKNKKKSKSSTSRLRKQKSSNFDSTWFVDHNVEELFNKNFEKKAVLAERVVALDELRHTSIPSIFRARDWEPLLNPVSPPSKLFVREFYANIHVIDKPSSSFTVYLRGHYVRVTPTVNSNLYGLLRVPDPTFPYGEDEAPSMDAMTTLLFRHPVSYLGNALTTKDFTVENHVLTRIVCTNLYPVSHMTFLSLERVRFIFALLSGASIDIASHICDYMLEVYENASGNQSLPFPCLVNRLVTSASLPSIAGEAAINLHGPIGLHSISLSRAQLRKQNSASASVEVPSSSEAPMSFENTQPTKNPQSSTPVRPYDTPFPNTLNKLFTYLVDSTNLLNERSLLIVREIDMLKNDYIQIKSHVKRIEEHLGITTTTVSSAAPSDTVAPAAPIETAVAFAPPPHTSAPRRLDPSSSDTAATSSASDAYTSENNSA